MLASVIAVAGLQHAAHAQTPVPDSSRSTVGRWADSGHAVWRTVPRWMRDLGLCIRRHESINAGHYASHNGTSSASGAYQYIDSTWQGNARWAKWRGKYVARGYKAANHAPAWVQDVVFVHTIQQGGIKAWRGTGCPGT